MGGGPFGPLALCPRVLLVLGRDYDGCTDDDLAWHQGLVAPATPHRCRRPLAHHKAPHLQVLGERLHDGRHGHPRIEPQPYTEGGVGLPQVSEEQRTGKPTVRDHAPRHMWWKGTL